MDVSGQGEVTAQPIVYVTDQGFAALTTLQFSNQYWLHYTQTQGVTYANDPKIEPFRFRSAPVDDLLR